MASLCVLCNRRTLNHDCVLRCSSCLQLCHIRCLSNVSKTDELYVARHSNVWLCQICISGVFPFCHISDDDNFKEALLELSSTNLTISLKDLESQVFNVFETNDDESLFPMVDIDPDLQYFNNVVNSCNIKCNYYLEDLFKDECLKCKEDNLPFSLFSLNVRSLPKHVDQLKAYLITLHFNFAVIGLSETWLNDDTLDLYYFDNYTMTPKTRSGRRGGGVSLLVKNGYDFKTRDDVNVYNDLIESMFIVFDKSVFQSDKNIVVGLIYRPPDTNVNMFIESMNTVLSNIKSEGKVCYLMGDYNLNLLNADSHKPTQDFIDLLYSFNYIPLITKPTRVGPSSATLIDNIFTNNITSDKLVPGILYTDISDHFPVFLLDSSFMANSQVPRVPKSSSRENHLPKAIFLFECYH